MRILTATYPISHGALWSHIIFICSNVISYSYPVGGFSTDEGFCRFEILLKNWETHTATEVPPQHKYHNSPQLPVQRQYYQYCSSFNNIQYSISTEGNSQEEKNKKNLTKWPHFLCWWKLYSAWIREQSPLAHFANVAPMNMGDKSIKESKHQSI